MTLVGVRYLPQDKAGESILALDVLNKSFYHLQPLGRPNFFLCLHDALYQNYVY